MSNVARSIEGLSNEAYFAMDAINWSTLKLYTKPAKLARHMELNPRPPSKEMSLGTKLHAYILEHDKFRESYYLEPKEALFEADGTPKARDGKPITRGMTEYKEFMADIIEPGKTKIQWDEAEKLIGAREAFLSYGPTSELLSGDYQAEQTAVWERGGKMCKGKLDLVVDGVLYDYKTTGIDFDEWQRKTVWNQSYHGQLAWYLEGLSQASGVEVHAAKFIIQQPDPPFDIAVINATDALPYGRKLVNELFDKYCRCQEMRYWPGYSNEEVYLEVPQWVKG